MKEGPVLDPITVEVIGAALSSIVEETGEALVRASYSTNIKERRDCSTALFDREGRTLCQAEHIPIHLGSFLDFIPTILAEHDGDGIAAGDVFVGNDAYRGGGTHLPDIVLAEPIFVGGALVAWTVNLAHHSDFVDRAHAHIYQEGLRIPPIRLYRAGALQRDVREMILTNCQVPRERLSDLRAQMAANRVGVRRFAELCERHGTASVLAAGEALLDYAERKMRAGIAALPDGRWRFEDVFDTLDLPDDVPLAVTLTIAGDGIDLAFEAPPQVRAGINMTRTALLATVYYIAKAIIDPTVLPNAGLARPITASAPRASVLSCAHPAAVNGRVQTCQRVADLVIGAFAQAVPERVSACTNSTCTVAVFSGTREAGPKAGEYWVYLETIGGGGGARAGGRRARRHPCPRHQHLEPARGGAGGRVSPRPRTLRARGRLGGRGTPSRRHGPAPRLPRDRGLLRARGRVAQPLAVLGARRRGGGRPRHLYDELRRQTLRRWRGCAAS